MADASVSSVEETLTWERAQRTRAGALALVAGGLTMAGGIASEVIFRDLPRVPLLDALRQAAHQPLTVGPGLRSTQVIFYNHRALSLLVITVVLSIGSAAMAGVLGYLFRAASARAAKLPRVALFGALVGPILLAVAGLVLQIGLASKASTFAHSANHSTAAAHDAFQGGLILAAQILRQAALLLVSFGFIMISLNAMRVGLLPRFMGILGIIVGALLIIPIPVATQIPVVQCFWLVAIGILIFDRWPGPEGRPSAWSSGVAEPWPTQQELREQRLAAQRGEAAPEDDAEPVAAAPADRDAGVATPARRPDGVGHPTSKKRKNRKRR